MILLARGGGNVATRSSSTLGDFGISAGTGGQAARAAGVIVSASTVGGIPAVTAAVRRAAQEVASLQLGVYRGQGVGQQQVAPDSRGDTGGRWQAKLFAGRPNDQQDRFQFKEAIEESLSYRGNAYIWKNVDPASGRVLEWYALHPDQVLPSFIGGERSYWIGISGWFVDPMGRGWGFVRRDSRTILHIRGFGDGGSWIAPSPIMRHASALGTNLARVRYEESLYDKGAAVALAVTFPERMTAAQAKEWRDLWQDTYGGPHNAGRTAVLGGGAQVQSIGLSQVDAQFVESQQFSIEDVARIFNVPASLIGGGHGTKGDHPLTPEHEQQRWLAYGLSPRLFRIESALAADPDLFPTGTDVYYPWFNTTRLLRGDLATEAMISLQKVQSGQWLVDEARALDGLPPLPGGAGKVPQIVPVGGGPNPDTPALPAPDKPSEPAPPDQVSANGHREMRVTNVSLRQEPVTFHIPAPNVYVSVEPTPIHVEPPHVNVAAPSVSVAPAAVSVHNDVTVEPGRRRVSFERNSFGHLTGAEVDDG